jgi:hypothetical protein
MIKRLLIILLIGVCAVPALAGPPEIPEPPETPEPAVSSGLPKALALAKDSIESMKNLEKKLAGMDEKLAKYDNLLRILKDSLEISEISIGGDSIVIRLSNDSIIAFQGGDAPQIEGKDNSLVNVGHRYTVDEGEIFNGNLVNIGADVIVKGTVNGSVWTFGGDIYVTSTGRVGDAIAFSGKVKQEPGGQISNLHMAFRESKSEYRENRLNGYSVMAIVFLIIFFAWMILSATATSLMKPNVTRLVDFIKAGPAKAFFMGYMAYLLALAAMIALLITILGIPLALIGVPVAVLAGMVLSSTALSNLIGRKILNKGEISFKTFTVGALVLSGLPGLFFLIQLVTGSVVIMVFSWLFIAFFIFMVAPFGLGAVLKTRFGTRDNAIEVTIVHTPPVPPTPPNSPMPPSPPAPSVSPFQPNQPFPPTPPTPPTSPMPPEPPLEML